MAVYACSKGRPTEALTKLRLECLEQVEEDLVGLKKDFLFCWTTNVKCLFLCQWLLTKWSVSSQCIRRSGLWTQLLVSAFLFVISYLPYHIMNSYYIWIHNTYEFNFSLISIHMCFYSSGTNRHKKELFVMAVRTPWGKSFPGNFSIIPSSKKWVFHAIFHLAFLELYGDKVCSMNCLVLTDEEDAEYRPFESLIATNDKFKSSKVMLCIFHAMWQPFKRDIYTLCPRK